MIGLVLGVFTSLFSRAGGWVARRRGAGGALVITVNPPRVTARRNAAGALILTVQEP